MKKTGRKRLDVLLALVMIFALLPAAAVTSLADAPILTGTATAPMYTISIPASLEVARSGWNATEGISATGTLENGKKLSVTASSENGWALKSGDNSVGYNLATAAGTYSVTATPASWEFTQLSDTAVTLPMGVIVEDYSAKPAGTYQDTVTFMAKLADAPKTITINSVTLTYADGDTWAQIAGKNSQVLSINEGGVCDTGNNVLYIRDTVNDWSISKVASSDIIDSSRSYLFIDPNGGE